MSRVAYVNGRYVPHGEASVHIEDRGYQFADGVYEVCEVFSGRLVDETRHLDRLERSLSELRIDAPLSRAGLRVILREVVARNRVRDGLVYLQVTRGVAKRDHVFPAPGTPSALVITAKSTDRAGAEAVAAKGIKVITVPDNRWERVDIKSVGLLPNVMARQLAKEAGGREAWFVDDDGLVTEGAATNAWIVTRDKTLVTRPANGGILKGVTRTTIIDLLNREGLSLEERPFSVAEAKEAREAFISAATTLIMPVVQVDDAVIGNGQPGMLTAQLRQAFHTIAEIV